MGEGRGGSGAWAVYGRWAGRISLVFVPMYPLCNWLTARRSDTLGLFLHLEMGLPFVREFIWVYFSMYALFLLPPFLLGTAAMERLGRSLMGGTLVAGVAYLLIPSRLGFEREVPDGWPYGLVFGLLFNLDEPHNMFPSLHVIFSTLLVTAFAREAVSWWARASWLSWLALICASTVLVRQHHLADVAGGLVAAWGLWAWSGRRGGGV